MIGALLRFYSYLYHLALAFFLFGAALVAVGSRSHTLSLGMLPWKGSALSYWLLGVSLLGLLSIVMAWKGNLRFLFLLYAVSIFVLMFRGYFWSSYSFHGKDEFRQATVLTAGALIAIAGAWSQFSGRRGKRRSRR